MPVVDEDQAESIIRAGNLVVDLRARTVSVDDQPVQLTSKEFSVLEILALRKNAIVTKEMLLNHLYGGYDEPEMSIINSFVGRLRKKLAQVAGGQHYIETTWGRGYALRDPADTGPVQAPSRPWTIRRKAELITAVTNGEITIEEALERHHLSEEEFNSWRRSYEMQGLPGLRATRYQQYSSRRPF